jgi:membrane protease YdiL (CAAX protease family)
MYPPPPYPEPTIRKKMSQMPLIFIFLVCITVYWLPYIVSNFIGISFIVFGEGIAELVIGIALCVLTFAFMVFIRGYIDRPTWKEYGLSTENLGSNLLFTVKLIFVIVAIEFIVISFFQYIGVSFEGDPREIDILFIISAVILAPIFEETVYRMNASTLLARRLPIFWVAWLTAFWFIAKHLPMWHLDDGFGLPAVLIIIILDVPLWAMVTYYYLKRQCVWIPLGVHMFNNGAIALFYFIPDDIGIIIELAMVIIGIFIIIIAVILELNKRMGDLQPIFKIELSQKTLYYFALSVGLGLLFLVTTEALVGLTYIDPVICIPIGFALLFICIITVGQVLSNRHIEYVKD